MSLPFRCEDADTPGFDDFRRAISDMISCACCGGGRLTAEALEGFEKRRSTPFTRLGFPAWRETIRPRRPRLPQRTGRYILPDVTVVDPETAPRPRQDVEIDAGRIIAIRPTGAVAALNGVPMLEDCRGAYVASGLVDMHAHMPPDNALKLTELFLLQMLRHGVTAVRDAGDTDGSATPAALTEVLSGALPGPEIHYAFAFVNQAPARWVNAWDFTAPSEAPAIVARLKALGASWVKSYENLDVPRIEALKAAAAEAGLGVMGHTPYRLAYEEALLPDAQHFMGVPPPDTVRRDHVVNRLIDWDAVDEARVDVVRRAALERGLAMTPTIHLAEAILDLERHAEARHEASAKALPAFFADIIWHPRYGIPVYRNISADDFDRGRSALERKRQLLQVLHRDGVELRLGTDTLQPFSAPGVAFHREMAAFEAAGIPRRAVWRAATADAMRALGITDGGQVTQGARADLLISRKDPLGDGWDVQADLVATVARGALIYARDLDGAITRELGRFQNLFAEHASRWMARFTMDRLARNFVS